jgi:YHS domain-containing protein
MRLIPLHSCIAAAILLAAALLAPACTSARARASVSTGISGEVVHAQCLVCKSEGDLACVDVKVRADTPRTEYMGRTYYFCSVQCKKEFEKAPKRYLERD